MKTLSHLIKHLEEQNLLKRQKLTPFTKFATEKFGSKKTLNDVGAGAGIGHSTKPEFKGRRPK